MNSPITYTDLVDNVLHERKLKRSWLSKQIHVSDQNMSYHWKRGTFPTHILEKIQQVLEINLHDMKETAIKKAELQSKTVASESATEYEEVYTIRISRSELKQVLLNHNREIYELRKELDDLQSRFRDHLYMSKDKQ